MTRRIKKLPSYDNLIKRLVEDKKITLGGYFQIEVKPSREGKTNGMYAGSNPKYRNRIKITASRALTKYVNEQLQHDSN